MDFLVPNVPSVPVFQMLPRHVTFEHLDWVERLERLEPLEPLELFLNRGTFSQIDFDHLRIFRDAGRRTLSNLLPGAENYDAL
jgi:hypothetical protein